MTRYVGLDAHSKRCVYVIQDEQGRAVGEGSVPTTPVGLHLLRARYALPAGTRVALESGTMAFFVARLLTRLELDPLVVDAHEVRMKALRPNQKSDRRDALELCEGLRRDSYRSIVLNRDALTRPKGQKPATDSVPTPSSPFPGSELRLPPGHP